MPTTATSRRRTSSRWRTRRPSCSPTRRCSPSADRRSAHRRLGQRLRGRRLRRRVRQGRARPARHVPLRRQVVAGPGGRRHRRHHLQRGQHARAPESDLRRQPARPAGDDRCGDLELHARQRPAAGLQAGQEPDRRLQGLRHVHGPLPAAGDRRDARTATRTTSSSSARTSTRCPPAPASTTTAPARRRCSPRPRSSPTATTSSATRSASPGGVPRRTGLIGSTYYAHNLQPAARWTRST